DIDAISMAGIPVRATPGVGGGFEIMPGFKLDKKVFTANDLSALLMGLSSLSNVVHGDEIIHTLSKVKSFIPAEQAEMIAVKANQIRIDLHPWMSNPHIRDYFSTITSALSDRHLLSFSYIGRKGALIERTIEPYQLVSKNGQWYVYGFCNLRKDYRLFKLSRIIDLRIEATSYTPKDFPAPRLTIDDLASPRPLTITLRIHKSLTEQLLDYCSFDRFTPDGDSHYLVSFPFIDQDYYYGILLSFGDKCECLAPDLVRKKLQEKILQLSERYRN
ncbi:MAG: YafY family protein, partial [bacterium]|nr:YafY family protein [bacterium]